ncbi:MAG: nucleoside deaminase [Gammaproteobacteria bacterium]|jgi:tRNA(Arg) A34 adenosine deaminase TadA|nr:nucleoside deaminase [Gammaproteobacteria bacterium]
METIDHKHPMQLAIDSAIEGITKNEGGPFGACVVKGNQVISVAHNTVLLDNDPTCHAEMNAVRKAAKALGTYDLSGCDIYSTVEPCPMCLTAIYWARINKIYAGAENIVAAQYGFDDDEFYQQVNKPQNLRKVPCEKGILAKESEDVFIKWKALGRVLY